MGSCGEPGVIRGRLSALENAGVLMPEAGCSDAASAAPPLREKREGALLGTLSGLQLGTRGVICITRDEL